MEDPPEDAFVTVVRGPWGNARIFEGQWEDSDGTLQDLIDCVFAPRAAPQWGDLHENVAALVRLSDAIAARAQVERWAAPAGPADERNLRDLPTETEPASRVTFEPSDLDELGIPLASLAPFVLDVSEWDSVGSDTFSESRLHRRPLVLGKESVICALPGSLSLAARLFLLEAAQASGRLDALESHVRVRQEREVFQHLIPRLQIVSGPPPQIARVSVSGEAASIGVVPLDTDSVAQVLLLHDNLADLLVDGVVAPSMVGGPLLTRLVRSTEELLTRHRFVLNLVVFGGVARTRGLALGELPSQSGLVAMGIGNLRTFASLKDASLLRVRKFERAQSEAWDHGLHFFNLSGFLNEYAYWAQQGFSLVPDEMPMGQGGMVVLASDFLFEVRVDAAQSVDRHAVALRGDRFATVERFRLHPILGSARDCPIYVAPDALESSQLAGAIEAEGTVLWVIASSAAPTTEARGHLYAIWEATLDWLWRSWAALSPLFAQTSVTRSIYLELSDPQAWAGEDLETGSLPPAEPAITSRDGQPAVEIPAGFLTLLNRSANDGEKSLMHTVYKALLMSAGTSSETHVDELARNLVETVLSDPKARNIHVFQAKEPADYLEAPPSPAPRFLQPEDLAWAGRGLAWNVLEPRNEPLTVKGSGPVRELLFDAVDVLWSSIKTELSSVDRDTLVQLALANLEGVLRDRVHWRRTASAMNAMHQDRDELVKVAGDRESERVATAIATRVMVEMAICTCPANGGQPATWETYDHLAASITELVRAASHWEAVRGELAEPQVSVVPSGRLILDQSYVAELTRPYFENTFSSGFERSIASYESLFKEPNDEAEVSDFFDHAFQAAFREEYGLTLDALFTFVALLFDAAQASGSSVCTVSLAKLTKLAADQAYQLAPSDLDAALGFLCLSPRARWDRAPGGFIDSDWYPWRFRRRLSTSLRPLVRLGDEIHFSVSHLSASIRYRIDGLRTCLFPTEHFQTRGMLEYVGTETNARGRRFNVAVAEKLEGLGWTTETEVLASTLGGPAELGDFDVLAWRAGTDALLAIECKSLIPRNNLYELVEELLDFRGEATDRLGRHLARISWLDRSLDAVQGSLGIPPTSRRVVPLFIANREMPMRYLATLPLNTSNFVAIEAIDSGFAP